MPPPLRILHLEDDPNDAELVESTLEADAIACEFTRVRNQEGFVAALERGGIDLILSDFSLPAFDGMSATRIVRERWPDVPVILVSGMLGEETAVESLRNGATDYVLKGRLARLGPVVRRAILEAEARVERRRLGAQLIEAQKMDVIGQLTGGVAHDFNNLLGIILGYLDLIAFDLEPDGKLQGFIEEIRNASERAVGLTRQLLLFSSQETVNPVVLDLNTAVKDMSKMLLRLIGENIEMKILPGQDIGRIKADPGYVGQVIMNLVVNARDAMPNGGRMTISTCNATLGENTAGTPGLQYVTLSVSDTGTGMTDTVKARLFEAFFTTKPKGKGTGLGLSTCQTIVQQSGGHIEVESELGGGTTFKVFFPRVDQPLGEKAESIREGVAAGGSETLLVVEDEPSVRTLAGVVLESQGYQVLLASNGRDALQMASEHKGSPIRLVITDVIMPHMGGRMMAEWLKTADPDLRILFTSGYTDDALAQHGVSEEEIEFLPKPYTPAALLRKVREVLDSREAPEE